MTRPKGEFGNLAINVDALPKIEVLPPGSSGDGALFLQCAFGLEMSMSIATRSPGYHSKPHRHASEQLNYIVSGDVWLFCGEEGYRARKGDIVRVPSNVLHWCKVVGDVDCTFIECHGPPLIGDPKLINDAWPLLKAHENRAEVNAIAVEWPEDAVGFARRVEAAHLPGE